MKREDVAILTLWTKKDIVEKALQTEVAIVTQLYSRDEGINKVIRGCLENKAIRHIIVTGTDLNGSGKIPIDLATNGVAEDHSIKGSDDIKIDKEIPQEAIERFREHVTLHDLREEKDFSKLDEFVQSLEQLPSYGESETFPEAKLELPEKLFSEESGFLVREKTIGEAWLKILNILVKFGTKKPSQYNNNQREVCNIMTVVTEETYEDKQWKLYFPFSQEELTQYVAQTTSGENVEGVEYTYGSRLRDFHGIEQLQSMVEKLKEAPHTRRAIAVTWDVAKDVKSKESPCLILLEAIIQENKLFLTAYLRSNDMFDAWPRNAYALRSIQEAMAKELEVFLGPLTTVSCAAHMYENRWKLAEELIHKNPIKVLPIGDPRGNFTIKVDDKKIVVTHQTPEGRRLKEYEGTTATQLAKIIVQEALVSEFYHAAYLGTELQKAEQAIKENKEYIQDHPI